MRWIAEDRPHAIGAAGRDPPPRFATPSGRAAAAASEHCLINDNLVIGNSGHGIGVGGIGHRVSDNIVRSNGFQQLWIDGNAVDVHAYDNLIEPGGGGSTFLFTPGHTGTVVRVVTRDSSGVQETCVTG